MDWCSICQYGKPLIALLGYNTNYQLQVRRCLDALLASLSSDGDKDDDVNDNNDDNDKDNNNDKNNRLLYQY